MTPPAAEQIAPLVEDVRAAGRCPVRERCCRGAEAVLKCSCGGAEVALEAAAVPKRSWGGTEAVLTGR